MLLFIFSKKEIGILMFFFVKSKIDLAIQFSFFHGRENGRRFTTFWRKPPTHPKELVCILKSLKFLPPETTGLPDWYILLYSFFLFFFSMIFFSSVVGLIILETYQFWDASKMTIFRIQITLELTENKTGSPSSYPSRAP